MVDLARRADDLDDELSGHRGASYDGGLQVAVVLQVVARLAEPQGKGRIRRFQHRGRDLADEEPAADRERDREG